MHTHYVCHQNNRQISLINNIILFRRFSYDRNYAYIVNITLPRSRSPNHTIATEPRRGERRKTLNVGMFSSSASLRLLLAAEGDGNGGGKCWEPNAISTITHQRREEKKNHRRLNSTFLDRAQPRRFSLHLTAQRNAANWRAKENTETDLLHHHTKFRIFFHNFIFFPFFFLSKSKTTRHWVWKVRPHSYSANKE